MLKVFLVLAASSVLSQAAGSPFNLEIVILGFVPTTSYASLAYNGPAFQTGLRQIRQDFGDVFNVSHVILQRSSITDCFQLSTQCDDMAGGYFYGRKTSPNMTVFVVPGCMDTLFTHRLVTDWNIPYITSVHADPILRNRILSPTWITTTPVSVRGFVLLYLDLFRKFNWTTVFFITDEASVPFLGAALIKSLFAAFQSQPGHQGTLRQTNSERSTNFSNVLADFRRISRICVYLGHARPLKSLLVQAGEAGMTDGDYMYIGVDTFLNIKFGNFMWADYNATAEDPKLQQAIGSLLVISLAERTTLLKVEGQQLEREWRRIAKDSFNYSIPPDERMTPYMFASHAAVEILGQILNKSLKSDPEFDPTDGAAFARKFLRQSFRTQAINVNLNEVGEPRIELILQQFNAAGKLTTVADQFPENGSLNFIGNIRWPNGRRAPFNRPLCGFLHDATSCLASASGRSSMTLWMAVPVIILCVTLVMLVFMLRSRVFRLLTAGSDQTWWYLDWARLWQRTAMYDNDQFRWNC
ncbi:hypothetical protein BV898_08801 [Hypsibius exemplaris]|uniref:Receptor ligand binding region domain-containing protein n=1 Tax=Hypsibius exemplaris TaxID=2072580 RepID=A0A1W0WPF1_HYPEX|nr:hypothetical protein BV898_08801 [Hypsibius exemplaris]